MKIGILTFHRAANYGAVLQAYALQHYLSCQGYDTEIIDYKCKPIEQMHSPFYFVYCKGWKNKCKQLLRFFVKGKKRKIFNRFIERKLRLSNVKKIENDNKGEILKGNYDIIIAGSDQIWNPYLTQGDTTYLLDFVSEGIYRVSYAASIGIQKLPEKYVNKYNVLLQKFDKLSVREEMGNRLIQEIIGRKSEVVIDPTLLLSVKEWNCFMNKTSEKHYVLLYTIKANEKLVQRALEIAKEQELSVIYISDTMVRKKGIHYVSDATPEEWVGLFAGASYVVTNSFHGTAFSIIFNKNVSIGLAKEANNGNSRILDLLTELEIKTVTQNDFIEWNIDINWKGVNEKLADLRQKSSRFLHFYKEEK